MQQQQPRSRRRARPEWAADPEDLDSADTFFTSVPKPIGIAIREAAKRERRSYSSVIRDALMEKYGATAAA